MSVVKYEGFIIIFVKANVPNCVRIFAIFSRSNDRANVDKIWHVGSSYSSTQDSTDNVLPSNDISFLGKVLFLFTRASLSKSRTALN